MEFDAQFFVAVVTVIFFALTFKPIKNSLVKMLDARIDGIRKNLAEAERLKQEALKLLQEAQSKLDKSEQESKQILEHARNEAEKIISNTKAKLEKDVDTRKKLALQKIQSFEDRAIDELKKGVSVITVEVAAKAIEESGNEDDLKKLISGSVEKISKTIH